MPIKTLPLLPGPQTPLDPFSGLGDGPLLLSGEQLALGLAFLSNAVLAPSPAIGLPATLKSLSGLNIVPLPTPAKQTASVLLLSSSPSMTSPLLAQGIPAPSTLLSVAVIKTLAPSPAIDPQATLKLLSGPNIVPLTTPAKKTASVFLPLSSLSMTSPLVAQVIPAPSTLLSDAVVKPFIPPAIQSSSLTPLFDPAMESPAQGGNQRQSTSVSTPLPSPRLDLLENLAN